MTLSSGASPAAIAAVEVFDVAGALERAAGDRALLAELAELFEDEQRKRLLELHGAIDAGDGERLRHAAHGLEGSSASLGGGRVSALAGQLGELARAGRLDAAGRVYAELELEAARFTEALRAFRQEGATCGS